MKYLAKTGSAALPLIAIYIAVKGASMYPNDLGGILIME